MALINPCDIIPTHSSKPEQWIEFHRALRDNFPKKIANQLWVQVWAKRGDSAANTSDLRDYLTKQGIIIDKSAWDSIVDTTEDVFDFFGDFFKFGKTLSFILLGGAALGIVMIIFNIAKKPVETASAIRSVTPIGRGTKLLK